MTYIRGNIQGFDEIAEKTGEPQWKMSNMLKYFRKMEHYEGAFKDGEPDVHSQGGYIHVQKLDPILPVVNHIMKAGEELGYKIRDANVMGPYTEGCAPMDLMLKSGARYSTYDSLLRPIWNRQNLIVRKFSHVTRILMDGTEAYGVEYERFGETYLVNATKEVILSAGTFMTPKILMLSGIGPKNHLDEIGIETILDLPVGQRLQDKFGTAIGPFMVDENTSFLRSRDIQIWDFLKWIVLGSGITATTRTDATFAIQTNISKNAGGLAAPDIHVYVMSYSIDNRNRIEMETFNNAEEEQLDYFQRHVDKDAFLMLTTLARPHGFGTLKLKDKNPYSYPLIDPEYLSDERDVAALVEGMKIIVNLSEGTAAMREINAHLSTEQYPACRQHKFKSDSYYECFARHISFTAYKLCGTVPLGKDKRDTDAVVDPHLRVMGAQRLRVIDASVLQLKHISVNDIVVRSMAEMMSENILKFWSDTDNNNLIEGVSKNVEMNVSHKEDNVTISSPAIHEFSQELDACNFHDSVCEKDIKVVDPRRSVLPSRGPN